jgi:hypothetical protein
VFKKLFLVLAATGLMAGPANATPKEVKFYVYDSLEICLAIVADVYRGNHALYCEYGPQGWYIAYDQSYEENRKGPKR